MDRRTFMGGLALELVAGPVLARNATAASAAAPLATLAPGFARRIGPYANPDFADGAAITDYSSITLDAAGQRMLLFGGGHGPSQETDLRALDLRTLKWSSVYAPTPRREMTRANCDADYGRYRTTNQPTARHSYNLTLVRGRRFYMLCFRGMPDHLDGVLGVGNGWGGRVCWYDFDSARWSYSRIAEDATPWYFASAAVLDPKSGKILVAGPNAQGGEGALWVYDPDADAIRAGARLDVGYSHDIVYHPPTDRFVVLQADGRVWEIALDRDDPMASRVTAMPVTGTPPQAKVGTVCGFAYDASSGTIGGNVIDGNFHAYEPATGRWTRTRIEVEQGSTGTPAQAYHCLDLDPASGCYVLLATPPYGSRETPATWLYRPRAAAVAAIARGNGVADLSVELDFGAGAVARFAGADAVDRGAFIGEHVRQRGYLLRNPAFPDWSVWFRVDEDEHGARIVEPEPGWRDEIVVEYGRAAGGTPRHHTTPYVATLRKGDEVVARHRVARHPWYARWRHASSQRPIVRTVEVLRARRCLPAFGRAGMFGGGPAEAAVTWDGPLSVPARPAPSFPFDPAMAAAGDHEQIGFLTEAAASYVIFGNAAALTTLRTEGEWCANWCMHIRDDATGAMPDARELYFRSAGGSVNDAPAGAPATLPGYVAIEAAHWYPCANLPWLLTEDPFHLEALQFGVNWRIVYDRTPRVAMKLPGLVYPLETRALAWGLRDLFLLAATTPESVPGWLRPRAHWRDCLEDNRAYAQRFVDSPARIHALFRAWPRGDLVASWMSAWLSAVVGMAIDQGFEEWAPIFAWSIDAQVQMTNGRSGWSRQWPVPYASTPNKAPGYFGSFDYRPHEDRAIDATTCESWADYWAWYASGGGGSSDGVGATLDTTGWDGHTLMAQFHPRGYASYFLHLRSALAVAVARGVEGARACYDYLHGEMASALATRYHTAGQARFAIDPPESAS